MCSAELKPLPKGVQRVARALLDKGHSHGPVLLDAAVVLVIAASDSWVVKRTVKALVGQLEPASLSIAPTTPTAPAR